MQFSMYWFCLAVFWFVFIFFFHLFFLEANSTSLMVVIDVNEFPVWGYWECLADTVCNIFIGKKMCFFNR